MYNKIQRMVYAMENNPVLFAVKKGFLLMIPVVLTGSFALLLENFPLPAYQTWVTGFGGGFLMDLFGFAFQATTGFLSLYLVLAISYYYSDTLAHVSLAPRFMSMMASAVCFIASFGSSLTLDCFGTIGVFTAMVCAILGTRLFFALERRLVPCLPFLAADSDSDYHISIAGILPLAVCVTLFSLGNLLLKRLLHVGNLNDLIGGALFHIFGSLEGEPENGLVFLLALSLLWVFGIHGGNALDQVSHTVFMAGARPDQLIDKSFLDTFAAIGGSGCALCLLLALFVASKRQDIRRLSCSAAPLALFNINELLVFGLPIVLNPVLAVPFVLTPLVSMVIAYGAVALGLMPAAQQAVSWTTPVLFSGWLSTGSWRGAAVQLVIVAAGTLIYLPFVRLSEGLLSNRECFLLDRLSRNFQAQEAAGVRPLYLERSDSYRVAAKALTGQLIRDVEQGNIPVFYQPQVDAAGRVVGVEALLRWRYCGQQVYPPLVVSLAQEAGCFSQLSWAVFDTVFRDVQTMHRQLGAEFHVSVNMTPGQLNDPALVAQFIRRAESLKVCGSLVVEVTEEDSLAQYPNISAHVDLFNQSGIALAIDDFSMGKTSLQYLYTNRFQYVKLDGSLVRQLPENPRSREIVGSITALGESLGFRVVAEWVESEAIRDCLLRLNCPLFQGYLYSPAVPLDDLIQYALPTRQGT